MIRARLASSIAAIALLAGVAHAQLGAGSVPPANQLVRVSAPAVEIAAGGKAKAIFTLTIERGWHINANPPSPDYMIPTALEMSAGFGVTPGTTVYPPPKPLKVGFDEQALFVLDGAPRIEVPLEAMSNAQNGTHTLSGTLRFQSCNDQVCLAPATIPVTLEVKVTGGSAAPFGPRKGSIPLEPEGTKATKGTITTAPPEASHAPPPAVSPTPRLTTTPPGRGPSAGTFATGPSAAALDNPLARALDRGGWGAFLTLFLIGLALNLTPCVYPMLGVTVSIFGARRAAPPLQVFAFAVVYVLGMAVMYSSLGLIAAFTGGLFGGMLSNPIVLIGIGVLLVALSLSMFGLYEFQISPQLLSRLGGQGATSIAGTFLSGLAVGVFAAPCIGPPVVALLAVVGAKGDPWFGFRSFFVLAMGLGAPYLVLGTFSNLIQRLPRSGEWMVWVKKVFGVILLGLGLFYASLALAPQWGLWIAPVALVLGGIYLGFFEKSADNRPGFFWLKRLAGGAGLIAGVLMIATAPKESIVFETLTPQSLEVALASGAPVMLDFTANWCAPCHELERFTFTDARVRAAAGRFRRLRMDLTRYDSPESARWRREYAINGVPTVLFLKPDGDEVREARVEGFVKADQFLDRMRLATGGEQRASGL